MPLGYVKKDMSKQNRTPGNTAHGIALAHKVPALC